MKYKIMTECHFKFGLGLILAALSMAGVTPLRADTITIRGLIDQSIPDGTGPAVNNPGLNGILDGDSYTASVSFTGSISAPGTYDLAGLRLLLSFPAAGAAESGFTTASLTIAQSGGSALVGLLACLSTGAACNQGNELDLNFTIPLADLNNENVAAQNIPALLPLDLLEDDGVTDIHGSITSYSYTPTGASTGVPEPSVFAMLASGLIVVAVTCVRRRRRNSTSRVVPCLLIVAALVGSVPASAADGVVLINQATVMAAGGFPFKIAQPGTYKLTGSLVVPAETDGIEVLAEGVTLDLNGFTISGAIVCRSDCSNCLPLPHIASQSGVSALVLSLVSQSGTGMCADLPGGSRYLAASWKRFRPPATCLRGLRAMTQWSGAIVSAATVEAGSRVSIAW